MKLPRNTLKHSIYKHEWEHSYASSRINGKILCLLCGYEFTSVGVNSDIKGHHESQHGNFNVSYPLNSRARIYKIRSRKDALILAMNSNLFNVNAAMAIRISFQFTHHLVANQGLFTEEELFKSFFVSAMKTAFENTQLEKRINRLVDNLDLSRSTIAKRIGLIAIDLRSQLLDDLARCDCFSCQLIVADHLDHVQVVIIVRMVFPDLSFRDEFFTTFSLTRGYTEDDLHENVKREFVSAGGVLDKLVSITTAGSPTMKGFLAKCRDDHYFSTFWSLDCVLHRLTLCAQEIPVQGVIEVVGKIVDRIISQASHRQLYLEFKEVDALESRDFFHYTGVSFFSQRSKLKKFYEYFEDIVEYLKTTKQVVPELCDTDWLSNLVYLVDLAEIIQMNMNDLEKAMNVFLLTGEPFEALKAALSHAADSFNINSIHDSFPRLKNFMSEDEAPFDGRKFLSFTRTFENQLTNRFSDISDVQKVISLFRCPVSNEDLPKIPSSIIKTSHSPGPEKVAKEIMRLTFDFDRPRRGQSKAHILPHVARKNFYHSLLKVYKRVRSVYYTTHLCDRAVSRMRRIQLSEQSVLSYGDLKIAFTVSLSGYEPNLEKLTNEVLAQESQ